jgi:hypothetical protein
MSEAEFAVSLKLTMKMRKAVLTPPSEKRPSEGAREHAHPKKIPKKTSL